jgi:hypothetical protein
VVYCFHGGQASPYQHPDSHVSNSFLELKDSTLIPFNEHHTFEDVLDLNKLGFESCILILISVLWIKKRSI